MFIQTETTPNPNALKFLFESDILESGSYEFLKTSDCRNSDLAKSLLQIDGIEKVFFGKNFVSISKSDYGWDQLKAPILKIISDHLSSGQKAVNLVPHEESLNVIKFQKDDYDIVKTIEGVLLSKIKPAISQDGGDVEFREYKEGIVYLQLKGSCAGCPSATLTLKNGIENLLKNKIPEVKKVEQVL
tara:strand:+ start:351 stop:911 length:561 start_codon:yes stop_codon:yes gene_type:complete